VHASLRTTVFGVALLLLLLLLRAVDTGRVAADHHVVMLRVRYRPYRGPLLEG
jgi:hypothetical protein